MKLYFKRSTRHNFISSTLAFAIVSIGWIVGSSLLHIPVSQGAIWGAFAGAWYDDILRIFLPPKQYLWCLKNLWWTDFRTGDDWGT